MVKKVKSAKKISRHTLKTKHVEVYCCKKEFGKAPEEKAFVLHDGRKLKTLYEFVDELETMSDDAFREYVTWERNDFANWINDVFEVPDLATEMRLLQNRFDAQRAVLKHFVRELVKLAPPVEHKHHKGHEKIEHKGTKCVL